MRDFLPSLLLLLFSFRPRSTFQRNKSAVLCVNFKQPSIHQHLWIDVNNIKLGIDRTVLLRKG